jgi:acetyl-CoA C-acetyltransferase/acetyl-CoA acyltransferase
MTYIYDAVRTPRGKGKKEGALASLGSDELVAALIESLTQRTKSEITPEALILGAVGQVGAQGGNIALASKFRAGLPNAMTAFSLNNLCVSGLTAVNQAASMVASGQAQTVLAGGVEMMSRVPFMADKADFYTDATLPIRSRYLLVALAADRLAEDLGISRGELDQAALVSQQAAAAAEGTDLVASRIPVNGLDYEECLRVGTLEALAALEPAFGAAAVHYKEILGRDIDHRHTIAHAPPMSDGAGIALLGAEGAIDAQPRARIIASAEVGGDPAESLTAGFNAMQRVFERSGLSLDDMDRIEFMEAFGVTIVKFMRDYKPSAEKVNVGGGHMAKGHPLGASGAILLSSLMDALDSAKGRYGLVVASGASGTGSAMIIERIG